MRTKIASLIMIAITAALAGAQQDQGKRPSPAAAASCKFDDGKEITTAYSSPRMKGRRIFGDVVPYNKVWRTGANEATTLVTDADLTVEGKEIPAGSYTLFTIPAADKWTLIISKKTGEPGTPYPEGDDLLRIDMKIAKALSPVENFTIAYHKKDAICTLTLAWEDVMATINLAEKNLCWPTTSPLTYSCPDQ